MTNKEQYLAAGMIYGFIALVFLVMANVAIYGAFWGGGKPELVIVGVLFGWLGCGSMFATLYAFKKVL